MITVPPFLAEKGEKKEKKMVYKNFEELNAEYPERSEIGFEDELSYVNDCFDTYESIGFNGTFKTPYEDKKQFAGMKFTVDGRLSYVNGEADITALPMWHITFENGEKIDAYPEEICKAENLYFVSQSSHGHEYVWIFDEEGLRESGSYETIIDWLDKDGSAVVDILWPMGGSNSSATYIVRVDSEEDAKNHLLAKADGPDSEDPMLVELAEYLRTVDTDYGVTKRILDKYGLKAEDLTQYDNRYDELIGLGVKPEDFYGDRSDERYSEVKKSLEKSA